MDLAKQELNEATLMLKALKLVPEFQGLTLNQVEQLLDMIKGEIMNAQTFELNSSAFQARVEEWQVAYQQRLEYLQK